MNGGGGGGGWRGSFPRQEARVYLLFAGSILQDVLMRPVLIMGLSLTVDQDNQMALRFDDGMLNATRVSTHT